MSSQGSKSYLQAEEEVWGGRSKDKDEYGIKVVALTANTDLKQYGIKLAAEVDQNIDQPFAYNATDTLTAAFQGRGLLAARFLAATPGTDCHATAQLSLAGDKAFRGVAGADEAQLDVEGMPSLTQRRYECADFFGRGNGPGIVCATQLACSKSGSVTDVSWGYRLRGSLSTGTSSDGAFVEGRITLRAAVDANFMTTPGVNYNIRTDRDIALFSLGMRL